MRTTGRSIAVTTLLVITGLGFIGGAHGQPARTGAAAAQTQRTGSAAVTVYHVVTGEPLAGLPVTVRFVRGPNVPIPRAHMDRVIWTNNAGGALFLDLPVGVYDAAVFHNNVMSEPARFQVLGNSRISVKLLFNPDID